MKVEPLAATYSRALVELASGADRLEPMMEEVRFLSSLYRLEREFRIFMEYPSIGTRAKIEALERIFRGKLDDLLLNFLEILLEKKRQFLLPEIFSHCEVLYDELAGRVHVAAITAVPIDPPHRDRLVKVLQGRLKKNVVLENQVQPEVLGGLILRIGDLGADNSIRRERATIAGRGGSGKTGSELVQGNQP